MTLLRALPDEYSSFASSLQMLDELEQAKIQEAFVAEELLRNCSDNRDTPSGALSAPALATSTATTVTCEFLLAPRSLPVYLPSLPHCQSHSSAGREGQGPGATQKPYQRWQRLCQHHF